MSAVVSIEISCYTDVQWGLRHVLRLVTNTEFGGEKEEVVVGRRATGLRSCHGLLPLAEILPCPQTLYVR